MSWEYDQSTGVLTHNGAFFAQGCIIVDGVVRRQQIVNSGDTMLVVR